jgi:hypothetical protein
MRQLSLLPCRAPNRAAPTGLACCSVFLAAWVALLTSAQQANAQTSAPSGDLTAPQQSQFPQAQQASPQLPASGSPSGAQTSLPSAPSQEDALENPVLEQADEDDKVTGLESRIAFTYDYAGFDGGASGDYLRFEWVQAFGPGKRLAVKVEFPFFIRFDGGAGEPNANGVGDTLVEFAAMLGKGEKFEHAAAVEVTAPSASDSLVRLGVLGGEGETVIRVAWGFSAQVTPHTLLSGDLGYNKAVHARYGPETINEIEPELILSQAFGKRVGGYLEWNTYYDFTASQWAQAMKVGIEFVLDRREKWSVAPYFAFALNDFAREMDFRNNAGVYLSRHF